VHLRLPTKEEEERSVRFQVNKNYLLGMRQHLEERYGATIETASAGLVMELKTMPGFSRIQRIDTADEKACRTALSLSWTGLIQLELASWSEVAFNLPYTNAWAPVHAYYAVSSAARAWLTAQGQPTSSHASTLKAIGSEVQGRRLYPSPWNVFCAGCCHERTHIFVNAPHGMSSADPGILLRAPDSATFWPRYLKMLETTRKNALDIRYEEWKKAEGRKQIRAAKKREVAGRVPATTVFDFLWRLRVRSNYHGVEPYLMAHVADAWQHEFYESIRLVSHLSSLMFDTWLAQRLGRDRYADAIDDFMQYRGNSPEPVRFLEGRRMLLGPKPSPREGASERVG
jgi:hypothetical protein